MCGFSFAFATFVYDATCRSVDRVGSGGGCKDYCENCFR